MYTCYQCNKPATLCQRPSNRLFCAKEHARTYHEGWSTLLSVVNKELPALEKNRLLRLHLGMKRAHDDDDIVITLSQLEDLPPEVLVAILKMLYMHVWSHFTEPDMKVLCKVRETSITLRDVIDDLILLPIKSLSESVSSQLTDDTIGLFKGLTMLAFTYAYPYRITEKGLAKMSQLEELVLDGVTFGVEAFRPLTNLKKLLLMDSEVTNECLFTLSSLEELELFTSSVDEDGLSYVPQLKELTISADARNKSITGASFAKMTRLEKLIIHSPFDINGDSLLPLANTLVSLSLDSSYILKIGDETLSKMILLKELILEDNQTISDAGISMLTNLTKLTLHRGITSNGLSQLSMLTNLDLYGNENITVAALEPFRTRLRTINIYESLVTLESLTPALFPALKSITIKGEDGYQEHVSRDDDDDEM